MKLKRVQILHEGCVLRVVLRVEPLHHKNKSKDQKLMRMRRETCVQEGMRKRIP